MADSRHDEKKLSALAHYLRRPRTFAEIQERTGLQWRTVYRWIGYLRARGHDVISQRRDGVIRMLIP